MERAGNSTGSLDCARDDVKIVRARVVVPMVGEPIENGAVAITGNRIAAVGPFEEVKTGYRGDVLDLGEHILLPGLINAHCHLDYTRLRGQIPPQKSFTDWIRAINASKAELTAGDYVASINEGFAEALRFGTTTVVNLTAFPELIAEIKEPIRTWWFGELIDVRNPDQASRIVDLAIESLRSANDWGLAPHAPFTASLDLYRRCEEIARREDVLLTTHVAESHEEMQMFRDGSGPLYDFLKSIGRPMDDCGANTPLAALLQGQALDERWIVAHLNELTEGDFDLLARAKRFHIAHCPRSHAFFGHTPFELRRLRRLGFNICLGTDSLASNSSLSLFSEMRELLGKEPWISPREVLMMATVDAARAIGQADLLGKISPGFRADLIAIPSAETGTATFDTIVAFEGTVPWMMMNGETLSLR
jgi:cytosine/adenosine deaminase-related metal-dependent hydrolase